MNETLKIVLLVASIAAAPGVYAAAPDEGATTEAMAACSVDGIREDACFDYLSPLNVTDAPSKCDPKVYQAYANELFNGKGTPAIGGETESVSERNDAGEG